MVTLFQGIGALGAGVIDIEDMYKLECVALPGPSSPLSAVENCNIMCRHRLLQRYVHCLYHGKRRRYCKRTVTLNNRSDIVRYPPPLLPPSSPFCHTEALGMCPSGSSSVPAVDARGDHGVGHKKREARLTTF